MKKEEARKQKQEQKRNKRLHKGEGSSAQGPELNPAATIEPAAPQDQQIS